MGIAGLLPFLSNLHKKVNISKYKGKCVAVDTSCWLHRGAFSCAYELAIGLDTRKYISYIVKRINILQFNKIYPVMVFDGCNAPSKKNTNDKRRENRQAHREKGKQLLAEGKKSAAVDQFQKSISITNEMVLEVIKECQVMGVPVVVAPYEADAQLTYLVKEGLCDLVITEDSDLLAFGCQRVLFKMDDHGDGVEIDMAELGTTTEEPRFDGWTHDKFRQMCIISGCDYLDRLPKCGLKTVHKQFRKFSNVDRGIKSFLTNHNVKNVDNVDIKLYYEQFLEAEKAFKYHLVFDPVSGTVQPLNSLPPHLTLPDLPFLGSVFGPLEAVQRACGNINPQTGLKVAGFLPAHRTLREDCARWRRTEGAEGAKPALSNSAFQFNTSTKESETPPKPIETVRKAPLKIPVPSDEDILDCYSDAADTSKRSRLDAVLQSISDDNGEEILHKVYGAGKRRKTIPHTTTQHSRFYFGDISDKTPSVSANNPFRKEAANQEKENVGCVEIQEVKTGESRSQPNHRVFHSSAIAYERTMSDKLAKAELNFKSGNTIPKLPTPIKEHPFKCGLSKSGPAKASDGMGKAGTSVKPERSTTSWISTQPISKTKIQRLGLGKPQPKPQLKAQPKLTTFFKSPPKSESDETTKSHYF